MVYAQIQTNTVVNAIQLDDSSLVPLFAQGYQFCLEIDNITDVNGNQIGIGWYYDSNANNFWPPILGYPYPESLPAQTICQTVIDNNMAFGNSIIAQMNADVAAMGIYQAGLTTSWLNYLQTLYMLLQNGFLLDAINEYNVLIADSGLAKIALGSFINNTSLTNYQTMVQNWVNS